MLDAKEVAEEAERKAGNGACHSDRQERSRFDCRLVDLVTEMREVKHPFQRGILAQRGIEY